MARIDLQVNHRQYYVLVLVLVIGYLFVGWLAVHPQVSPEYRAYYLEKQVNEWSGPDGLEYELQQCISFDDSATGTAYSATENVRGWYGAESWGRWTKGNTAHFYLSLPGRVASDLVLVLEAVGISETTTQPVDVVVNDSEVGTLHIKRGHENSTTYSVRIPNEVIAGHRSLTHIEFIIHNPVSPQQLGISSDTRQLGMMVQWMKLSTVEQSSTDGGMDDCA